MYLLVLGDAVGGRTFFKEFAVAMYCTPQRRKYVLRCLHVVSIDGSWFARSTMQSEMKLEFAAVPQSPEFREDSLSAQRRTL